MTDTMMSITSIGMTPGSAYHAVDTEPDRAHFRADEDHRQHDEQLQYDQECCHCRDAIQIRSIRECRVR